MLIPVPETLSACAETLSKTRVWGSEAKILPCTRATAELSPNWCWGCEQWSGKIAVGQAYAFKYDPFGIRIQKSSASGTINYLYDGENVIAELDSNGTQVARYAQSFGIDQPLAMLRGGVASFYQADGLGSITSLTDTTGMITNSYGYDCFGTSGTLSGTMTNPFRYTAREFDSETGIYYYRARYYDPSFGRFVSEDPIRFAGTSNFYTYTQNRPVNAKDPSGLKIMFCSRDAETLPGNHGFLYDTRNGDNCGKGRGNYPHGHENINNPGTFCNEVPGSDGHEDAVMSCCRKKASSLLGRAFFFPWGHDCQNLAGDCLKENGLSNPEAPGGRMGCRGNCGKQPNFDFDPYYKRYVLLR